jgi:hypothetical protein
MTLSNKEWRVRNWKLHAVRKKAADVGFKIKFVRKIFGPQHVQDRIYINGRRCHLMPGSCLNPMSSGGQATIDLRVPENMWAEFLIYVPEPVPGNEQTFFIVPRNRFSETTLRTPDQLREHADNWCLLTRRSE